MRLAQNGSQVKMNSLDIYFRDIERYPLLEREEEYELARAIKNGDESALEKLVNSNLRYVVTVAKRYSGFGVDMQDLIAEANIGLIEAAQQFDDTYDCRFLTCAIWYIKKHIFVALARDSKKVSMPRNKAQTVTKINKMKSELFQKLQREPGLDEVAKELNLSDGIMKNILPLLNDGFSLDEHLGGDSDATFLDMLESDSIPAPDHDISEENLKDSIEWMLCELTPREAKVLRLLFGLDGEKEMVLGGVSEIVGVSRQRVAQIKDEAFAKICLRKEFKHMLAYRDAKA